MARKGGHIEPTVDLKRYGLGDGYITVTPDGVSITVSPMAERCIELDIHHMDLYNSDSSTMMIDPDCAPLFRMIANRLDEIGRRNVRS